MSELLASIYEDDTARPPAADAPEIMDGFDAPAPAKRPRPARLAWRALLLDERAYATVAGQARPLGLGFQTLIFILAAVLAARLAGFATGYLTAPRLGSLQTILRDFITGLPWYTTQIRQSPLFATRFDQAYLLVWEELRVLLGIPSPVGTGLNIATILLATLLVWLAYGVLAHSLARWLGGRGRWQATFGALALAYAPLLLLLVEIVPGAGVPLNLLFLLMLVGKYQALKSVHQLSPGYTLAALLLPYLLALLLLLALALFGGAFGLEQIPYFDAFLDTVRTAALWR